VFVNDCERVNDAVAEVLRVLLVCWDMLGELLALPRLIEIVVDFEAEASLLRDFDMVVESVPVVLSETLPLLLALCIELLEEELCDCDAVEVNRVLV
jgi:hypothetical protein